ncbi:MAG: radical SAM protein [Bacteroidota bacterium]
MKKFDLSFIVFELTPACNLNCRYCYNVWKMPDSDYPTQQPTYRQARKVLKRAFRQAEIENVTFTGGEPFLFDRFAELVLFSRLRKKSVTIISNGNKGTRDDYKMMIKMGATLFEFPLHSHTAEAHDYMTRVDGSWAKSKQSCIEVMELGGTVVGVIVLTKANAKTLPQTLQMYKELGIQNVMMNRFNIGGNGIEESKNLTLTKEELNQAFRDATVAVDELGLSITSNVCTPFCVINPKDYPKVPVGSCSTDVREKPITIDLFGNVRLCNHSPVIAGNIFEKTLSEIFTSEYINEWKERPVFCNECAIFEDCLGGCRAASEQMGQALSSVDPLVELCGATIYKK